MSSPACEPAVITKRRTALKNRMREIVLLLSALLALACLPGLAQDATGTVTLATSAAPANPAPRPGPASWGVPEGRTLFPHNWLRGYVDFSFAPPHNEPDLGRCSQSSTVIVSAGGANSTSN